MFLIAWRNLTTPDLVPSQSSIPISFLAHLLLFGVLGLLASYNVYYIKGRRYHRAALTLALLVGFFWGLVTEGYQAFVPSRAASFLDLLTDILGAGCGGLLAALLYRLMRLPAYSR